MFGITFRKETEEERWLRKALDGDHTATEWIHRRHERYLSALCSRYITEDEDIKDVLQESFIKIFLTSSLRHPKIFIKEFGDFLMPCHQHCLSVYLLVQR